MITAYRNPDQALGKKAMQAVIDTVRAGVPAALTEIIKLGRCILRSLRAGVPLAGEPVFRVWLSHRDVAG